MLEALFLVILLMNTNIKDKQSLLSQHLLLLQLLDYCDLHQKHQDDFRYRDRYTGKQETNWHDVRLLDTIAVALTTGIPGDIYAAVFNKDQGLRLVLAKNDSPTEEDRAAAQEFISLIQKPETQYGEDLFPFLIKRCGANINHRIERLKASMSETLFQDFDEALKIYSPNVDLQSEFRESALRVYGDNIPAFSVVWNDYIQAIIKRCETLDLSPDPSKILTIRNQFIDLCIAALVVMRSRFFKWLIDDKSHLTEERRLRVERFKRRMEKCCQYVTGIRHLIRKAKRLPPISHEWVTRDFTGSGQGELSITTPSALIAVQSIIGQSLDEATKDTFTKILDSKSKSGAWTKGTKGFARVHAEVRIILHFGPPLEHESVHAIGVSKRTCLTCALWIKAHNDIFNTQWMTSGCHGKPYPNWALPGGAYAYESGNKVDEEVMKLIYGRLQKTVKSLIPGKRRISDDHVSSGGETSDEDDEDEYMGGNLEERQSSVLPKKLDS